MNLPGQIEPARLSAAKRSVLLAAGGILVALLITAGTLQPDRRGLGTHQQLGLPPCSFRQVTGLRCPSCGMTTSWAHLVRGHVAAAFRANTGGALLGIIAVLLAPWAVVAAVIGRWWIHPPGERAVTWGLISVLVVTLADWIVRLAIDR